MITVDILKIDIIDINNKIAIKFKLEKIQSISNMNYKTCTLLGIF